jgi:hypothetical protein
MPYTPEEIQPYLDNYKKVFGSSTDRFICPITLEPCEISEIVRGHIVNEKIGHAFNRKVPVWGKVDAFYGTRVEEPFVKFVNMGVTSACEKVVSLSEFQISFSGGRVFTGFNIRDKEVEKKRKHVPVYPILVEGKKLWIGLKGVRMDDPDLPSEESAELGVITWSLKIMPAAWVATLLKMAHLTLFSMIRYQAVFNPSADVLRRFLSQYFYDDAARRKAPDYFRQFQNSTRLVGLGKFTVPEMYKALDLDTLRDNKVIFHLNARRVFAATLFYILHEKTFSVTVPQTTDLVDIGTATRLYDRLMASDPTLIEETFIYHFDDEQWKPTEPIRMGYKRSM